MCIPTCLYWAHACECSDCGGHKRAPDPPAGAGVIRDVSHLTGVLRAQLGSSVKAVLLLNSEPPLPLQTGILQAS